MPIIIDNIVSIFHSLYNNIVYLVEKDSSTVQMHEWDIQCSNMFDQYASSCNVNYIDRTQNIPTISSESVTASDTPHVLQNNVIEEDVLMSFITISLIWFIVAVIVILSTTIISLIVSNICSNNNKDIVDLEKGETNNNNNNQSS